jgi:hypothetical protein
MARLTGPPPFVGTHFGICIYEMYGEFYMRTASSLDAERVKTDPAFRPLMKYAAMLSCASRIAADVYALLPDKTRKHSLYKVMVGEVMQSLKQGITPEEAGQLLLKEYILPKNKEKTSSSFRAGKLNDLQSTKPSFPGFVFSGEYYTMPDFTKLLSNLERTRTRRKRRSVAARGSLIELLGRKPEWLQQE